MNYLLDTHSLIWFIGGDEQLSYQAREEIENDENKIFVSIASLWEISIKSSIGKLKLVKPFEELFPQYLVENEIEILNIQIEHLQELINLPCHHRDPFDRLIICQSLVEQLTIIGKENLFDDYGIQRLW